ncbi:MAG: ATP-binding protein [Clostridium sp.]|nr:ATP-binding protein [Clostridium sp.]
MEFKPLPIGVDSFEKLINNNYYYVDKTLLIKELLDKKEDVNLFTRPRRFGKTLNLSMLQYFFEKSDKDNAYLFDGLEIMKAGEKYLEHMGQYPTINLSLKSAKQPNFDRAFKCIKEEISKEYRRHKEILQGESLSDALKKKFQDICDEKGGEDEYCKSLQFLSECLEKYYDKKIIILIDEYDVPLENSFFEGFYSIMVNFIRSLFESALKSNSSLQFAVITGCLRISKESIFTGLNNLNIISILNNNYSEYFGFTQEEVNAILKYYKKEDKEEIVKKWYNGYVFGESNVYNPWSVIKYLYDAIASKHAFPLSYWANTSSNSIVKSLIEKADLSTKMEIENLIAGNTIEKPIHEDITYDEIYKTTENMWNFMFFTGYLKKVDERFDKETKQIYVTLKIPNEEVDYIFRYKVLDWFKEKIKAKDLSVLYNAIMEGNAEVFQKNLGKLLRESISFNDAYENFYHGFLVGVLMNISDYIVKSIRECGSGRSDIYIKSPSVLEKAVIIELKVADNVKELGKKCDEALEQIDKKGYEEELRTEGYEDITKYGIAFYRKDCMVKKKVLS